LWYNPLDNDEEHYMAGIIMDFEGQPVDSLSDAIRVVRDIVATNDRDRAIAFRDAWRAVAPDNADDNMVYVADWAYKNAPEKTRQAMQLLGVTRTVFGEQDPATALQGVWQDGVQEATPDTLEEAIQSGVQAAEQYDVSVESEPTE
jgi:hypothetical protein